MDRPALLLGKLEVGQHDQIEAVGSGIEIPEIGRAEIDLDAALGRQPARLVDGNGADVDRHHGVAALGQPDGIASLTAGRIEHSPRFQVGQVSGYELVGPGAPERIDVPIALVPVLAVVGGRG